MFQTPSRLAALVLATALLAACAQDPGPPSDPALLEGLPPTGRDPMYGSAHPGSYQDLRQHTHYTSGSAEDPEIGPDGKTLFFASTHDTRDFNIYAKGVDSPAVTRLTSSPGNERQPRVSPDGRFLAYVGDETGRWEIYLLALGTAEPPQRVHAGPGDKYGPAWRRDGKGLIYCARSEQTGMYQLWTLDLTAGLARDFDSRISGLFPKYSPQGEWIVFHKWKERDSGYASLWRIRPDGTDPTVILTQPEWGTITPVWSPDGTRIAFSAVAKSLERHGVGFRSDDIWTIGADGSALTQVTSDPASDWAPSWHGDRLFFVSDRSGTANIWSLPAR